MKAHGHTSVTSPEYHAESYRSVSINSAMLCKKLRLVSGGFSKQLSFCAKGKGLGSYAFLLSARTPPPTPRPSSVSWRVWGRLGWCLAWGERREQDRPWAQKTLQSPEEAVWPCLTRGTGFRRCGCRSALGQGQLFLQSTR